MRSVLMRCGGVVLAACLLAGCAEKLTYERWQTVHDGMRPDAVRATLGDPWQTTDQTWCYQNEDKGITAMIYFEGDKVNGKTWQCPQHGMQGSSPNVNQPGESEQLRFQTIK